MYWYKSNSVSCLNHFKLTGANINICLVTSFVVCDFCVNDGIVPVLYQALLLSRSPPPPGRKKSKLKIIEFSFHLKFPFIQKFTI